MLSVAPSSLYFLVGLTNVIHGAMIRHTRSDTDDTGNALWLDDYVLQSVDERMQADGPSEAGDGSDARRDGVTCPPVPVNLPPSWCDSQTCVTDDDCLLSPLLRCCYNGCVDTCLAGMLPPPVVDWIEEPKRKKSGGSWLVDPDSDDLTATMAEPCSTSKTRGGDALLCPDGLVCKIKYRGNRRKGIPNWGSCVPKEDVPKGDDPKGTPP